MNNDRRKLMDTLAQVKEDLFHPVVSWSARSGPVADELLILKDTIHSMRVHDDSMQEQIRALRLELRERIEKLEQAPEVAEKARYVWVVTDTDYMGGGPRIFATRDSALEYKGFKVSRVLFRQEMQ